MAKAESTAEYGTQDNPADTPPPDYTDGTWYVPAGSNQYVKLPQEE